MWHTRCGRINRRQSCAAGVYYCSNYRAAMSTPIVVLICTTLVVPPTPRVAFRRRRKSPMKFRFARTGMTSCVHDHNGMNHCYRLNLPGWADANSARLTLNVLEQTNIIERPVYSTRAPLTRPFPIKGNTRILIYSLLYLTLYLTLM